MSDDDEVSMRQDRFVPVKFCRSMCAACNGIKGKKLWCGCAFFDDPCPWTEEDIQGWLKNYNTKKSA